jgi:hypothetical protein
VVPYNTTTPDRDTDDSVEPHITEELDYVLDAHAEETGRIFKAYDVNHFGRRYRKWTMDTVDGETLYQESYPSNRAETRWHGRVLVIHFWRDGSYEGNTYLSLDADYSYHIHARDDEPNLQYREHIHSGEHERIQ